jgi:CO/xanthine dehydrogenase Mo-binding subunit
MIGESVARLEDARLIVGAGAFAADIDLPGQVHMRIVRSPAAHGLLHGVDLTDARGSDGVIDVWTAEDVADIPVIDFRMTAFAAMRPFRQPVLATDRVRYVGEPVAAVFATDAYAAEDAADLVGLDIEPLEPVVDVGGHLGAFDEERHTEALVLRKAYGSIDDAFGAASTVIELELRIGRHTGVPLECRGGAARVDPTTGTLEIFGAAKVPHYNRDAIARMLGWPTAKVVLVEGDVGGGFGVRGELYPEDVLLAAAAIRLSRPVKWVEDRREHLVATNHSRDQLHHIRAAVDSSGVILGIDDTVWLDQGAYVRTHAATVPDLTAAMLPGPYRIPAYRATVHVRLSNKTPAGTYRAPGRYEGTFARERLIDAIAARLGIHPLDVRRRNFISSEEMPFARDLDALGTPLVYDSGDYERMLDRVVEHLELRDLEADLAHRRAHGEAVGLGFACFVEKSGLGPSEGIRVIVDENGDLDVRSAVASVGQGVDTVLAQICADVLDVDYRRVRVDHSRTDVFPEGAGGAFASRTTVMAGSALHLATCEVRKKASRIAAELLEAAVEDIELTDGTFHVRGSASIGVTLRDVARHERIDEVAWFETSHMTYPYGMHAAIVRVDRETGAVDVLRYVVAYDVGRAINPVLVAGQVVGGVAQGLGGALFEEFAYDENGQPLTTTFVDYLIPTLHEMPLVEVLLSEDAPSPLNPLGVKGAGEGGTNACGAAIASAVAAALDQSVEITRLPITPSRLRALLGR